MPRKFIKIFLIILGISGLALEYPAFGVVSIGLSGMGSQRNANLEKRQDTSGSVNLSLALGNHFRISLNHRRGFEKTSGFRIFNSDEGYQKFSENVDSTMYAVNLTLVLYNGLVSPYVFGGLANKYYEQEFSIKEGRGAGSTLTTDFSLQGVPNYGFGFAIYLNRKFSFKITQTFSPGKRTTILDDGTPSEQETVVDSYTQVGINYSLF